MRIRTLTGLVTILMVAALAGCGGGGETSLLSSTTTISGMASKGPIKKGTVKVFAIKNGVQDNTPLQETLTDDNGNYTIDLGSYSGPALLEVTGGSYMDEVSAVPVVLKAPLRAVISNASPGGKKVAVTPLTELAYKKAKGGGALTAASIDNSNSSIAASFNLTDIISTLPVAGGSDDNQKKYAAACGSIAQLVNDNKGTNESLDDALPRLLNQMGDEMENNSGFSPDIFAKINDAITKFSNSGKNQTGGAITPMPAPTSGKLKMTTSGGAGTISAIDMTVNLPAGVTVKANTQTGEADLGVVSISGVAAVGDNNLVSAKFVPAAAGTPAQLRIILANPNGFGLGEFVKIRFDLNTGASFPAGANAFTVARFSPVGLDSAVLAGINAAPSFVSGDIN